MTCRDEGFIQAYLDGECGAEEGKRFTEHLSSCGHCQQKLEELVRLEDWTKQKLEGLLSSQDDPVRVDADAAWQRFSQQIGNSKGSIQTELNSHTFQKRGWRSMKKRTRQWVTGVSAAAVVAVSLSFPQVQAAASDLLSMFRVNKVEFVKLTQEDLQQAEQWISSAKAGELELEGLGKMWIDENGQDQERSKWYDSAEEARQAGVKLPEMPADVKIDGVDVTNAVTIHLELDVEKANQLFSQLQMEERFDEKLDGKRFSMHVPETVYLTLQDGDATYSYQVVDALELEAPEGVDLEQLRDTVLALPFIPDNVKKQMLAIDNWQETLPMPYVEGEDERVKEVKVKGENALLMSDEYHTQLIWQQDGSIHFLDGFEAKEEQVLNFAEKLK